MNNLDHIRHSLAHLLAAAVLKKYPDAKLGIGPTIEHGFYYDFLLPESLTPDMLKGFEKEMRSLINKELPFIGEKISPDEAKKRLADQPFKRELIDEFAKEGKELTIYHTGEDFFDLCKGGHVENTEQIPADAFKLTHVAGAYWRGDEKREQLQRVYGLAFETKKQLKDHLAMLKEAASRDHRKLGKELELFVFSELVGPGLPLYTPKGAALLARIKASSRQLRQEIGYQEVQTPQINKAELFKVSGHYEKYKDDMFAVHSNYTEEVYYLKPMNCPQHTQLFASQLRSYRDLPLRFADFSLLYRDEKPGELSGLTRLRSFSQDDGHCFCREDQIEGEFTHILEAITKAMERYGLDYYIRLSLRDENNKHAYLGDDAMWGKSQTLLRNILEDNQIACEIGEGEAAFYGPKMDLIVKDALGRKWQLSTIQLDFTMPQRFELEYIAQDGTKQRPIMIHSALVGSPERFLAILLEHYAGAFPLWLAPIQVKILTISEAVQKYAQEVQQHLEEQGMRVELDNRNESIGKKIREGEMQKIPYLLIIGKKEAENKNVAVRTRGEGDKGVLTIEKFISDLKAHGANS